MATTGGNDSFRATNRHTTISVNPLTESLHSIPSVNPLLTRRGMATGAAYTDSPNMECVHGFRHVLKVLSLQSLLVHAIFSEYFVHPPRLRIQTLLCFPCSITQLHIESGISGLPWIVARFADRAQ